MNTGVQELFNTVVEIAVKKPVSICLSEVSKAGSTTCTELSAMSGSSL